MQLTIILKWLYVVIKNQSQLELMISEKDDIPHLL